MLRHIKYDIQIPQMKIMLRCKSQEMMVSQLTIGNYFQIILKFQEYELFIVMTNVLSQWLLFI